MTDPVYEKLKKAGLNPKQQSAPHQVDRFSIGHELPAPSMGPQYEPVGTVKDAPPKPKQAPEGNAPGVLETISKIIKEKGEPAQDSGPSLFQVAEVSAPDKQSTDIDLSEIGRWGDANKKAIDAELLNVASQKSALQDKYALYANTHLQRTPEIEDIPNVIKLLDAKESALRKKHLDVDNTVNELASKNSWKIASADPKEYLNAGRKLYQEINPSEFAKEEDRLKSIGTNEEVESYNYKMEMAGADMAIGLLQHEKDLSSPEAQKDFNNKIAGVIEYKAGIKNKYPSVEEAAQRQQIADLIDAFDYTGMSGYILSGWRGIMSTFGNLVKLPESVAAVARDPKEARQSLADVDRAVNYLTLPMSTRVQAEGELNPEKLMNNLAESGAFIGGFGALTKAGTNLLVKYGMSRIPAALSTSVLANNVLTYGENFQRAYDKLGAGKEGEANLWALGLSSTQGAIMPFLPALSPARLFLGRLEKEGLDEYVGALIKGKLSPAEAQIQAITKIAEHFGGTFATMVGLTAANHAFNASIDIPNKNAWLEIAAGTLMFTPLAGVDGMKAYGRNRVVDAAISMVPMNSDIILKKMSDMVESGYATTEQYDAAKKVVEDALLQSNHIPSDITKEQKTLLLPILMRRSQLSRYIAIKEKEEAPPPIIDRAKKLVADADNLIKKVLDIGEADVVAATEESRRTSEDIDAEIEKKKQEAKAALTDEYDATKEHEASIQQAGFNSELGVWNAEVKHPDGELETLTADTEAQLKENIDKFYGIAPESENKALSSVEETAKALEEIKMDKKRPDEYVFSNDFNNLIDLTPNAEKISNDSKKGFSEIISEAYHKAKADGSNPELVKAVKELLTKKQNYDAVQKQSADEVDVRQQAQDGEGVGQPHQEHKKTPEQAPKAEEITKPFNFKLKSGREITAHINEAGEVVRVEPADGSAAKWPVRTEARIKDLAK